MAMVQHDLGNHKFNIKDESLHAQTGDGFMTSWCQSRAVEADLHQLLVAGTEPPDELEFANGCFCVCF